MPISLSDLLHEDSRDTELLIAFWQWQAKKGSQELLSVNFPLLERELNALYIFYLINRYQQTALFPSDELREKLRKEAGLHQDVLRWFIPLDAVLKEVEKISTTPGTILLKAPTLWIVKHHLEIKIFADIFRWAGLTKPLNGKKYATKLKADLYNAVRRLRYCGGIVKPSKNKYNELLGELLLDSVRKLGSLQKAQDYILAATGGDTKMLLRDIVMNAHTEERNATFYRSFFELFRIICPDRDLMTLAEFLERSAYRNEDTPFQTTYYATYQVNRVKDLIGELELEDE